MYGKLELRKVVLVIATALVAGALLAPVAAACEDPNDRGAILHARPPTTTEPDEIVLRIDPASGEESSATPKSFNQTFTVLSVLQGKFEADRVEVDIAIWSTCFTWAFEREDSYLVGRTKILRDGRSVFSPIGISWRDYAAGRGN